MCAVGDKIGRLPFHVCIDDSATGTKKEDEKPGERAIECEREDTQSTTFAVTPWQGHTSQARNAIPQQDAL